MSITKQIENEIIWGGTIRDDALLNRLKKYKKTWEILCGNFFMVGGLVILFSVIEDYSASPHFVKPEFLPMTIGLLIIAVSVIFFAKERQCKQNIKSERLSQDRIKHLRMRSFLAVLAKEFGLDKLDEETRKNESKQFFMLDLIHYAELFKFMDVEYSLPEVVLIPATTDYGPEGYISELSDKDLVGGLHYSGLVICESFTIDEEFLCDEYDIRGVKIVAPKIKHEGGWH